MDRIFLRDLNLACTIGVNDWEREIQQPVKIDLDLHADLREAGRSDDLRQTVDYKEIRDRVEKIVTESRYFLIEALAQRIADACLEHDVVKSVRVSLEKPGALRATRTVGVELMRSRDD
jgi:FolB domain-containing protein